MEVVRICSKCTFNSGNIDVIISSSFTRLSLLAVSKNWSSVSKFKKIDQGKFPERQGMREDVSHCSSADQRLGKCKFVGW